MRAVALGLFALAALAGCNGDLPAASLVDHLRLLAVRAEHPELAPGDSTLVEALAIAPPLAKGADPALPPSVSFAWFVDGALAGTSRTFVYTAPSDAAGSVTVTVAVADAGDGSGALACALDAQQNGGQPTHPDHCIVAIKRITVSRSAQPNQNPSLVGLIAAAPDPKWLVTAERAREAAERKPDGTYEALDVSWYSVAGKLDDSRTLFLPPGCAAPAACPTLAPETFVSTRWSITQDEVNRAIASSGVVDFWAVIRDDRGGVGWLGRTPR